MAESTEAQSKIVVPASQPMVSLLGSGDELLRVVEQAFPTTDIHVRGNEITVTGQPGEVALVERLFDELVDRAAHRPGPDRRGRRAHRSRCCAPRPASGRPTC